jgi:hypothetical protein
LCGLIIIILILSTNHVLASANRVEFNDQQLFLNGLNLAWDKFANDIGPNPTTPNLAHFEDVFSQIQANGGNSMRLWLHTTGEFTPEWTDDMVTGPGDNTIADLQSILDLAWNYDVGLILVLWSTNMMEISRADAITDRSRAILTQEANRQSYIDNALIPMVEGLKGHPAIIAWEIFNEPEGMSDLTTWDFTYHIPMSHIQAFVNTTAGAIHRADPDAKVTNGTLDMFSLTDVEEGAFNYYSDQRLIEAGGDTDGFLDFYTVHFYGWGPSPFEHPASYWGLDKPLVVAEFWADCGVCGDIAAEDVYQYLYDSGYAGALGWSWTDRDPNLQLAHLDRLYNQHPEDVTVVRPGRPSIVLTGPADGSIKGFGEVVALVAEASDPDGTIDRVEFFVNGAEYGEDDLPPYEINFIPTDIESYSAHAVAVDNDGNRSRSIAHRFSAQHLVEPGRLEAEFATYEELTPGQDPAASRGAYLEMQGTGSVTWEVTGVPAVGDYFMTIGYNLFIDSPKTNIFTVNGGAPIPVKFEGITNTWRQKVVTVSLQEGDNTIVLTPSWGYMQFDYIAFDFIAPPATLTGSVMDASDDTIPVYPVAIDLLDPVTGDVVPGYGVTNAPDGSYQISYIPTGDYKILFNAYDEANGYVDELYDGIPCNNGGCDRAAEGDVLGLSSGARTLDVELATGPVISGNVTDENGDPMAAIDVRLLDPFGEFIGLATTDESGNWSLYTPGNGDYFAHIPASSIPGYMPEVWPNHSCENCTPEIKGDPIHVNGLDRPDIDFKLQPFSANACKASDLISSSGFEATELSTGSLQFVSNASVLFTDAGQTDSLSVDYLDGNGQPLDPSNLQWCVEDDTLVELSPDGHVLQITASGFGVGSVDVLVRDPITNLAARGSIVFAKLQSDTAVVNEDQVITGEMPEPGAPVLIELARNAYTESLTVGMIIASEANGGMVVRIIGITLLTDRIRFEVEAATLEELYETADIEIESATQQIQVTTDSNGTATLQRVAEGGRKTQALARVDWECTASLIDLSAFAPTVTFDLTQNTRQVFKKDFLTVQRYGLINQGTGKVTGSWGTLKISVAPKFGCELKFPKISGPGIGIWPFSIGPAVTPKIGFEAKASSPLLDSVLFGGPKVEGTITWKTGFIWDENEGLNPVSESETNFGVVKALSPQDKQQVELEFKPFAGADLSLSFLSYDLVSFIGVEAGFPYTLTWKGPWDYLDPDYQGPSWTFSQSAEAKWDPGFSGPLEKLLDSVLKVNPFSLSTATPLFSFSRVLVESPRPVLEINCDPDHCGLSPQNTDYLDFELTVDDPYWLPDSGKADLIGVKNEATELQSLVAGRIYNQGKASGRWSPTSEQEGNWSLSGLLWNVDPVSLWRPYVARSSRKIKVGAVAQLDVQKIRVETGTWVEDSTITTNIGDIDCGEVCSTFVEIGATVRITAAGGPGWDFVEWRGVCTEPEKRNLPTCETPIATDITAQAVFAPEPVVLNSTSLGPFNNIGAVCPEKDASGDAILTINYSGLMEPGGRLWAKASWDNDADGSYEGGSSGSTILPEGWAQYGQPLKPLYGFCWGNPTTRLKHEVWYVSPTGVESNRVSRNIPRP